MTCMRQITLFLTFVAILVVGVGTLYFAAPKEASQLYANAKIADLRNASGADEQFSIEPSFFLPVAAEISPTPETGSAEFPVNKKDCPEQGLTNSQIEVHIFDDFLCPFCSRQFLDNIFPLKGSETLAIAKNVTIIFHTLPIHGDTSVALGKAAFCAGEQEKSWELRQQLFLSQERTPATAVKIMGELGADLDIFNQCLISEEAKQQLEADVAWAETFKINAVPSIIIGDKTYVGTVPAENIEHIIRKLLAKNTEKSLHCSR